VGEVNDGDRSVVKARKILVGGRRGGGSSDTFFPRTVLLIVCHFNEGTPCGIKRKLLTFSSVTLPEKRSGLGIPWEGQGLCKSSKTRSCLGSGSPAKGSLFRKKKKCGAGSTPE